MFEKLFKSKVRTERCKSRWKYNFICGTCEWFYTGYIPFSPDCCPDCGHDLVFKKGRIHSNRTTDPAGRREYEFLYFELWDAKDDSAA